MDCGMPSLSRILLPPGESPGQYYRGRRPSGPLAEAQVARNARLKLTGSSRGSEVDIRYTVRSVCSRLGSWEYMLG
jgi:hypothetical protein